eukprot:372397_1
MVREVLTICVGQAGIQLGQTVWEQYCAEHSIGHKGNKQTNNLDQSFLCFFEETGAGQYVPRNLMIDLEPNIIDNVKNSNYSKIFHPEFLLSGKEDAGDNFARGHYTVGKEMIDKVNDRLRKLVDNCDNVQGFVINNAVGGGTGSGLGALVLERVAVDYRKKSKLGFHMFPFNNMYSTAQTEAYNALLSVHWLLDHTEVSQIFDNRKLYDICNRKLHVAVPTYHDLNCIISKVISSSTASLRFEGELNVDLNELQCNVTFPRLHFMVPSLAPLMNKQAYMKNKRILVDGFVRSSLDYKIKEIELQKQCVYNGLLYEDLMNMIYCVYDIGCPDFSVYDI